MDAKHTPGPWTFDYDRFAKWLDLGLRGDGVCRVNNDDIDGGEALANANLISAAPDLLAACKFAVGQIDPDSSPFATAAIKELRAAIAKATGN